MSGYEDLMRERRDIERRMEMLRLERQVVQARLDALTFGRQVLADIAAELSRIGKEETPRGKWGVSLEPGT